jgi:hypothetical protein
VGAHGVEADTADRAVRPPEQDLGWSRAASHLDQPAVLGDDQDYVPPYDTRFADA